MPVGFSSLALVCAIWPCVALQFMSQNEGLAFIKLKKVAGSSFGGAVRRYGMRHGLAHAADDHWIQSARSPVRGLIAEHGTRSHLDTFLRVAMPNATMVTLLRDPVDRCMSQFYFRSVSKLHQEDSVENKIAFIKNKCDPDEMAQHLVPIGSPEDVDSIMNSYEFIGLMERFNESVLLLAHRLGASMVDMLFLDTKKSGKVHGKRSLAEHPPFEKEPDAVKQAVTGMRSGLDSKLISAANAALDKAQAAYGPSFAEDLKRFEEMLELVDVRCNMDIGKDCLYRDNGCAQSCIDNLSHEQGWS